MRRGKMFLNLLAACGLAMTSTAARSDHIPGHENCDPEFPAPLPGQEFFDGGVLFATLIGPLEDSVITNTTFDITYVSDGATPASDLFIEIAVQVDDKFREFCLTGADLGFGSGPGTFEGTLETDVLNGVVGAGLFPPNSLVDFVIDVVGGGAVQGLAFFVDSFITFDVIPPPDCPGDGCGTGGPCVKGLECFTDCGELVQGVECVLFLADAGGLFLLDNLGGFNVGDQVEVTGRLDPGCFTICLEGDGCIFQNTIADCVIDDCSSFTCGQNNNKVLLCHVPPGNPGNAHTICISPSALPAHLAQHPGDHCGPCAAVQDAGDLGELPSVQVDVLSNLPGVFVNIGPPDMFDDGGGVVALERFYQPGSVVVLNAPKVFNGRAFLGWNVEGIGFGGWYTGTSLALPIIDGYKIEAVYSTLGPARW